MQLKAKTKKAAAPKPAAAAAGAEKAKVVQPAVAEAKAKAKAAQVRVLMMYGVSLGAKDPWARGRHASRSRQVACALRAAARACFAPLTLPPRHTPAHLLQEARKKAGKAAGPKMPVAAKHAGKGRT